MGTGNHLETLPVGRCSPFPSLWSDVRRRHIVNFPAYKFGTNLPFPSFCLAPFLSILRLAHIRTRDSETCRVSFTYSVDATPTRCCRRRSSSRPQVFGPGRRIPTVDLVKRCVQPTSVLSAAELEFAGRFAVSSGYGSEDGQKTRQSERRRLRAKF